MNIGVIGTGYVGLVAGACLAESGNDVWCVDSDGAKIERLKAGTIPIYEPGLPEIVERNLREERLTFTTDLDAAVKKSFVIFIAVGTPPAPDGAADLTAVFQVATAIGRAMDRYKVIVVKSTVPVGTSEKIREILKKETKHPFDLLSNPEFLKQGAAVEDFMKPDRVVVGADDIRAAEILRDLYAPFVRTGSPVLLVDVRTAELLKYAANAFLAARISFMYLFHERDRQSLRNGGCQRGHGPQGARFRLANRPRVFVSRSGIRRKLFPERYQSVDRYRPEAQIWNADSRGCRCGKPGPAHTVC
jgi:UDPglucose 6-dehydrogenase